MDQQRLRRSERGSRGAKRGRTRGVVMFSMLVGALALGSARMTGPGHNAVKLDVRPNRVATLRQNGRIVLLSVSVRCSQDTVGEIDASLEQAVGQTVGQTGQRVRAVRNIAIVCDRAGSAAWLVFEIPHHRFEPVTAVLKLGAMAGFGEQFGQIHLDPMRISLRIAI